MKNRKYEPASLILNRDEHGKNCLVLGDASSPLNKATLKQFDIGTIISIGSEAIPHQRFPNIAYHSLSLRDQKGEKVLHHLDKICILINKCRRERGVLIHCFAGVSRSATFTIAYIMSLKKLGFQQAKEFVKNKRPCICPNEGFVKQLQKFEQIVASHQDIKIEPLLCQIEEIKLQKDEQIEVPKLSGPQ